jgi:hypothetical protein
MSNLTVSIQEKITLPNNNIETAINTVTIPGINQFVRRIDTIPYDFEGTGVGIISFVRFRTSTQTPGSFVNSAVKYIRITNLVNSDKFASIYIIKTNSESVVFKLDPGKSLMLSNDDFNASQAGDYVVEGYVDEQYYSDFVYINEIKAKAGDSDTTYTGSIQLEYIVASS